MTDQRQNTREQIVEAAYALLSDGGLEAISTRAVCQAAGVQAPTLYRRFGDMQGLMDAVARRGFAEYVERKIRRTPPVDPLYDLRRGWDVHVEFAIANPAVFSLMYGNPRPGRESSAAREAEGVIEGLLRRVAEVGRLRTSVERAAKVVSGGWRGVALKLIATAGDKRDLMVSTMVREAVVSAVTTDEVGTASAVQGQNRAAVHAVALRETLGEAAGVLSKSERGLLAEWLDRLADPAARRE